MKSSKPKTVLFIPGFQEDITSRDYAKTITAIEEAGYKVVFADITWSRTTLDDWVNEFEALYEECDPEATILAGFSYGAIIALVSAAKRLPAELWLFSLSPYFKEDIEGVTFRKSWLTSIGHRRADVFRRLSFKDTLKAINCKILFFYGENELKAWSDITYRHKITQQIPNAKTILIPSAKHDVTSDAYIESIERIINI